MLDLARLLLTVVGLLSLLGRDLEAVKVELLDLVGLWGWLVMALLLARRGSHLVHHLLFRLLLLPHHVVLLEE